MTPIQPSIAELRDEFASNDVRGWIWEWLHKHLTQHTTNRIRGRYKATAYSPSGVWDDASVSDLVSGFIIERGIMKGAVARAISGASDTLAALKYLEVSFTRYVTSERPRSLSRNIFDRLRDVLDQQPDFIRLAGVPPHSYYGLADWEDDPPPTASDELLRNAARFVPQDIGWVNYETGTRQSPGISSHDLERVVRSLLTGLDRLLSPRQMMTILEERFPLRDEISAATSATLEAIPGSVQDPLEAVEANDLAARALGVFTPRQRSIVQLMLEDPSAITVREVAARLGISKSTAANELRAIQGQFRLLGASNEAIQRQILDALAPLLRAG
ncbi:MAG: hypothetical protein ACJ796_14190 [Gemmatimonadaceae bacterium]